MEGNIGFIGLGLLGTPMAWQLHNRYGKRLSVWNRTREKCAPFETAGVRVCTSPRELIESSDCVILMVSDGKAAGQILGTCEHTNAYAGKTVIVMGTHAPAEQIALAKRVEGLAGSYLEAPVLGSIPQAKARELIVMVGGSESLFNKWQDFFKTFGDFIVRVGDVGKASSLKLALNWLIASLTASFSLSLAYIEKSGVNHELFMEILRKSALYAPTFDKKLERMLKKDFDNPNFPLKHLLKDVMLVKEEVLNASLNPLLPESIEKIIKAGICQGLSENDYSALFLALLSTPK
ncbi:MAG: NAD(P)-dependent oxidoreductase [Candidatus Dadabacteria bacterium]|nr:MAG: NAD(P)-dependent oxidoreductase [Candidatus Dadabacteria bacterium]